jgi:hypothetical protein
MVMLLDVKDTSPSDHVGDTYSFDDAFVAVGLSDASFRPPWGAIVLTEGVWCPPK